MVPCEELVVGLWVMLVILLLKVTVVELIERVVVFKVYDYTCTSLAV